MGWGAEEKGLGWGNEFKFLKKKVLPCVLLQSFIKIRMPGNIELIFADDDV